ncbi:MAG: DNA replication/repair protein RecF [Lachnospiraceae bacterium]|nr:DNA replication/repair protein RecF [Lachnospiraceae bacterium]
MIIKSIDLLNFRNYEELHLDLDSGITILNGENAQGKTNLLEAVYLASCCRSHRGAKDREMIRFHQEEAHIKMLVRKDERDIRIDLHLKKEKSRGLAVNAVPIRKTRDYLGLVNCVLFSPEDLQIVKEGPAERRNFVDTELCQLDKIYLNSFMQYKRALEQRNQLLRDIPFMPELMDTLDSWDEQLARFGREIILRREEFISDLSKITKPIHEKLSGGRESLSLLYEKNTEADDFLQNLQKNRDKDLKAKTTGIGPHRDDISFVLTTENPGEEELDARVFGSQGQQRTCALSVKLAEIELVKLRTGDEPVLLLDDVLSELDTLRQQYLLRSIQNIQTIITCTGLTEFVSHPFERSLVYDVEKGRIRKHGE